MANILETLIKASERAASVARSCCTGERNENLLIAEKCGDQANSRFDKDFKTIADVLAQESAKKEIYLHCPSLAEHVKGEECAEINGTSIKLHDNADETANMLSTIMCSKTARRMANASHNEITLTMCNSLPKDLPDVNPDTLGVWIDPIDATAEFIAGIHGTEEAEHGLPCVTVLIGAFIRATGEPIIGVINQPFYSNGKGRIVWGFNYKDSHKWGGWNKTTHTEDNVILMSGAEKPNIMQKFQNSDWDVKSIPGAGHKLLKVALGEAAAYIVTQGTTFLWDTCAPHAIIKARGGDLLSYKTFQSITYNSDNVDVQECCNSDGIIAYIAPTVLDRIKSTII